MGNFKLVRRDNRPILISKKVCMDTNLSLEAKGLFLMLWCISENDINFTKEMIFDLIGIDKEKMELIQNELIENEYLFLIQDTERFNITDKQD